MTLTQLKLAAIFLIMAVTFYPVFELSRCIISYNIIGGWAPGWQGAYLADFWAELVCGIWLGYFILLPALVNWFINIAVRYGRRYGN
jgi:hypothetical protein